MGSLIAVESRNAWKDVRGVRDRGLGRTRKAATATLVPIASADAMVLGSWTESV